MVTKLDTSWPLDQGNCSTLIDRCFNELYKIFANGKDLHYRREPVFSFLSFERPSMKIKVVVHDAEEGGFWAEVPAMPGCATQAETMDELLRNLHEAIEGCLLTPCG